jgi:3-deoxy-D-manno-octulosonate 8-phosphate phosphatase (KDO 8-P phosphatase)
MKTISQLKKIAKNIRLVAMDVDGVLTGGEVIVLDSKEEVKVWNVKDGFAFHLAHRSGAGITFAWITGRKSRQVQDRARESRIEILYQNCMTKRQAMEEIIRKLKIQPSQAAYLGDDLVDIPVFRYVGLSICPADAPAEVKKEADYVSPFEGGKGVLREAVELVLKAQGHWAQATKGYL